MQKNKKKSSLNNISTDKQHFRKTLFRTFALIITIILVSVITYGCIYTIHISNIKKNEEYSFATSSVLSLLNKCSIIISDLQITNLSISNAYTSNEKIASSLLNESEYSTYIYSERTNKLEPISLSTVISSNMTSILEDINYCLQNITSTSYARFDDDLHYAYYINQLEDQENLYMVVIDENIIEINNLLSSSIFEGSSLFINGLGNNVLYSHNIEEKDISRWETVYRRAAFDSASSVYSRQLIESNDDLLFHYPMGLLGYTFGGSLLISSVYSSFIYEILPLFILTIIIIVISVYTIIKFKRSIYIPIVEIEKGINGITNKEMNLEIALDESNEFFPMSTQINRIIRGLREILNREYNEKIMRKQAQISALQSQLNPHFLYNTFDSMRGQALEKGATEIANILKSMSSLFKYSIKHKPKTVTLFDELNNVDNYLYIQQYRFNNKFTVKKQIDNDEHGQILSYSIPKLTLQPIVENSLIHGIEPTPKNGLLSIRIFTTKHNLIIEIEDNGKGIPPEKLRELNENLYHGVDLFDIKEQDNAHIGIGMFNVNELIKLLYGNKYGLKIYSTQNIGTTVQIILPLIPTISEK